LVRVAIEAAPGTEIAVIDHNFRVLDSGIGALRTVVAPGLYKLRYRVGFTVQEDYQTIGPSDDEVSISAPPLSYASAAPLPATRDREPYYQAAGKLSGRVHTDLGEGSQLFIFARAAAGPADPSRFAGGNLAAGLTLHNQAGKRLLNLGKLAGRSGLTGRWAGCTVALSPGEYLLRYRPPLARTQRQQLEQVIVASPGWQTQVFLAPSINRPSGDARPGGLALARTSVLQARIGRGFNPRPGDAQLSDLARIGLINGHALVSLPQLLDRLAGESPDPMLGIYTAHAMLRAGEFDEEKLREVVRALRSLLGSHPDVEALAHQLGMADGYVFACPPMLTSSWSLILEAAARQPGLVPADSLAVQAATHLWGTGPWLLWLPDELASAPSARTPDDVSGLVEKASDLALLAFPNRREAADDPKLDDIEAVLLTHISQPAGTLASRGALESHERQAPGVPAGSPADMSSDLAAAVGLPPAAILRTAASLVRKLERTARRRTRFRRLGWRLRGPLAGSYLWLGRRKGPGTGRRWRGEWQQRARLLTIQAAVVLVPAIAVGVVSVSFRGSPPGFEIAVSDVLSAITALALSLTVGYAVFEWQRSRVRLHLRRARHRPYRTIGGVTGEVIGRDELCHVIIDDLRNRHTRRPRVIVANAGAGKTALLAQIGRLLAEQGAIPVTVRLRDAQHSLDFRELAHRQFILDEHMEPVSEIEGEPVWLQLSRRDKIVVLADGLEEALAGGPGSKQGPTEAERASIIRLALRQARAQRLPLVVTSRPDSPLMAADAAIMELEPLSEETAMEWLRWWHPGGTGAQPAWPAALWAQVGVADDPLYLQIAHQLQTAGLVPDTGVPTHPWVERYGPDRAGLRLGLLHTYLQALMSGRLGSEVPLSPADRTAAVDQLSVLACVGLERGTRQVTFADFEAFRSRTPAPAFLTEVTEQLASTGRHFNAGLAALWGTHLGLVEAQPSGVRFPDALIQAYLSARLIKGAMADHPYLITALATPGRELLTALVMSSQASTRLLEPGDPSLGRPAATGGAAGRAQLVCRRAASAAGVTALGLYATALLIDSADQSPIHGDIADEIADRWADLTAEDPQSLDQAKLHLIHSLGEAARTVAALRQADPGYPAEPACRQLYRIAVAEPSHRIRMEAAQQIAACGDLVFGVLQDLLALPPDLVSADSIPLAPTGASWSNQPPRARQLQGGDALRREAKPSDRLWRETVVRAWLAPLLAGSATSRAATAQRNLTVWLLAASNDDRMRPSLETALAQGFKYAANQQILQPQARHFLLEQAREMLADTRFWFARLTLMQALCLLSMDSGPAQRLAGGRNTRYGALVTYWAGLPAGESEHPFVAEARELATQALETRQPECFLWIDEGATAATIGLSPRASRVPPGNSAWIPRSSGWATLHPRAQKLLADVIVLLNLAERGSPPGDRIQRLKRADRRDLPPCLARDWRPLQPTLTIGKADSSPPGATCHDGCAFNLCPYPPHGETGLLELSEAFCRRQATHETRLGREFWREMGQRSRS
jgi:hypothetical protein